MRYPVLIEEGDADAAFGVIVPDLPGCFSAGDTVDEALDAAREAAAAWIDAALDAGTPIPSPSPLAEIRTRPGFEEWAFALIEIDDDLLDDTIQRVNITLPMRVLRRLDTIAAERNESRGAVIADLTLRHGR